MQFKENLKNLLAERRCTQAALAQSVGVKPNTVCDWLKKGTSPKIEHIYKIAQFFGVSFEYLFTGKENSYTIQNGMTKDEVELISYFRKLSPKEKYMELGRLQTLTENVDSMEKNVI